MAGLSFLPSATPSATDRNASRALSPGQSPIDVISLNLPRILGARPLASANLLGVGPAAPPVSPQQMVMQALMQSSMATPTMNPALSQAGTSPLGGTPSMATGSAEEELRKRLTELFGMSTASQPSPSFGGTSNGATTSPSPVFRPGDAGITDPVPPLPTPVPLQPTPSPGPTPSPAPGPGTFGGSLPDRTNRMRQ